MVVHVLTKKNGCLCVCKILFYNNKISRNSRISPYLKRQNTCIVFGCM